MFMRVFNSLVRVFVLGAAAVAATSGTVSHPLAGEDLITPDALQFFETKIRPVLVEQCYGCHSADGQGIRGGLMVDSREGLRGGGESGAAVVPGNLDDSLLWSAINFEDFQMPPRQQLPTAVLNDFKQWILMGAPDPRTGEIEMVQTKVTPEVIEAGRRHWAFQPPSMPKIPSIKNSSWPQNDIDRLIISAHREAGLQSVADADAFTMLRRLKFDLVGLPPEPQDVIRFKAGWSKSPTMAIETEVDRLLASPQFGERWGRHWLDVARYAESTGKEIDLTYPNAWRYRDYVIDSFNEDKPYNQFIRQQIAGDLLPVKSDSEWAENLVATGFLALGPKTIIEKNPRQFTADIIDEQIDVTTRVVMGISVACARCHDHKFDPIPQSDYYALAGIFQSTETFFGGATNQRLRQGSNLLILPVADKSVVAEPLTSGEIRELRSQLETQERQLIDAQREQRLLVRSNNSGISQQEAQRIRARAILLEREASQLRERLNQFDASGTPLTLCMGAQDARQPTNARVLVRGEINQPAQEVERGFVQVVSDNRVTLPTDSSGRLELADWMTDRKNPLTARVMVNRIWLHLLGKPLVSETDNFGKSGTEPANPALLDYLAIRFMESGWSVKSLIKEIATTRTYRLATSDDPSLLTLDPENLWLARANPRRLQAESIRDAMLVASGEIDLQRPIASAVARMGVSVLGPDGAPALQGLNPRQRPTPISQIGETYRSVYLPITRSAVPRSLEVFDFAEPTMVVGMREESNTATQALYLLNNEFVLKQSKQFADRVIAETDSAQQAIRHAFVIAYGRMPTVGEFNAASDFLIDANIEFNKTQQATVDSSPNFGKRLNRFTGRDQVPQNGRLQNRAAAQQFLERYRQRAVIQTRATQNDSISPMAQFCQALFASAEFRYLN